jgi:acetoin:2,6-dichlorophenolindophenol oxidoreductase subunit alpha
MEMSKELMIMLYRNMVRVRTLDDKLIESLFAGKIATFFHSGAGQEAPGAALVALLKDDDCLYYSHRSHGINKCLPKGMVAKEIIAEHFGRATGGAGGMAGFHYAKPELGIFGFAGLVGGEITLATGAAIACQMNGRGQVTISCFGDGATGRGTIHESMLMASAWKLPIIFFCENNSMAQWTHIKLTHPKQEDLSDFAYYYGMPSAAVDGQDILAVYDAVKPAIERARAGQGPSFLEIKTLRYRGHVEGLPDYSVECEGGMRSPEEVEAMQKRDPIALFKEVLLKKRVLTEEEIADIHEEAKAEMEEAERFADESPWPERPDFDKLLYAE